MIIYKNNKNEHIIDNYNYDTGLPEQLSIDEKVNNIVLTKTDLNEFKNKELTNLNLFLFNNKLNVLFVDKYNYSIDDKIYDFKENNKFNHILNYNIQYITADVKTNLVYNNKFKINLDLTSVNEDVYEIIFFNKNTNYYSFNNLTINDVNNELYYNFNLLSSGILFKLYKVSNKWFIDTNSNITVDNIHEKISNYLKNSFYI